MNELDKTIDGALSVELKQQIPCYKCNYLLHSEGDTETPLFYSCMHPALPSHPLRARLALLVRFCPKVSNA